MGSADAAVERRRVLLDVDTGVDDALALMLAFRSPELEVLGVATVSGNVPVAQSTANTLLVLEIVGAPAIPVVAGAANPLTRAAITAQDVHGADGLGGITDAHPAPMRRAINGAAEFLLETIRRFPDEVTLIATGPLTNIATAIQQDGHTMRRLRGLIIMGGAVRVPGNLGPVTEFNFGADPEAAAIVLGMGLHPTLVPLDVTEQVILGRDTVERARGTLQPFIREMTRTAMAFHREQEGLDGMFLHDPLAVGIALDPSLARVQAMSLTVECRGEWTSGMVVPDLRRRSRARPTANVCVAVKAAQFLKLFRRRVLN